MFDDTLIRVVSRRVYSFDVVKFDGWLIRVHGYDIEKHGSQADFIKMKFGQEARKFAENILDSKNIMGV